MYILNQANKSLIKAEKCSFKSLNLKERQDLQEWIAKEPDSLGENLLIIQKEFDGFADTHERLDLLAIDCNGNLVIIENKLDDSGKDVTWQAIKYASYCSSLSKQDVINIFQKYLGSKQSAAEAIQDFFDGKDIDDIEINKGNSQRIILVAANFKKEVTSSVLWLQKFNLQIKCVKVTPYRYNDKVLVDFDQIIPVEDTEEYQIKIANKEQEEILESEATIRRYNNRKSFWESFIAYEKYNSGLFSSFLAHTNNVLSKTVPTIKGGSINIVVSQNTCRVELYINGSEKEKNKSIYDKIYLKHEDIDQQINGLEWQRLDDRAACRIQITKNLSYLKASDYQDIFVFFSETSKKMMDVFNRYGEILMLKTI